MEEISEIDEEGIEEEEIGHEVGGGDDVVEWGGGYGGVQHRVSPGSE